MSSDGSGAERKCNIWAPWRMEYIDSLAQPDAGCFLCRCRDEADRDEQNLVLWRSSHCMAVLNRYPYTGGHALAAPLEHVADLAELSDQAMLEMMSLLMDLQRAMTRAIGAEGFNIGLNIGRCAGAGLPGHLHVHVVPRWPGDTNFMDVLGGVRVIHTSLAEVYRRLRRTGKELNLPSSPRE